MLVFNQNFINQLDLVWVLENLSEERFRRKWKTRKLSYIHSPSFPGDSRALKLMLQ